MGVDKWQLLNPNIPILRGYSPNVADLQAHYKMLQDLVDRLFLVKRVGV